ncbi:MAG: hypothetical protein K6B41_11155 [Butyrivibrio sp.]|nr:hypothetical protein [Butyrivibrio sp.]
MEVLDYGEKLLGDTLGVTAKAIIEITDIRKRDVEETDMKKYNSNASLKGISGFTDSFAKSYIGEEFKANIESLTNKLQKDNTGMNKDNAIGKYLSSAVKKQYEVMFNPSEIRIGGYGGGKFATTIFGKDIKEDTDERSSSYLQSQAHIIFSAKLLFDKTSNPDAFISDKLTLNASRLGKLAGTGIKKLAGADQGTSVQKEVEAFMAILRDPGLRMISFNWGKMCYQGVLNQANAQYTMFNLNGQPCRASVDISILCADDNIYKHSSEIFAQKYDEYWKANDKYNLFGQKKSNGGESIISKAIGDLNG